jgi:hypothetical protein
MATTSSQSKNKVFVMMELEDDLARKDLEGNVQFRAGEAAAHKKFFSDPGISAGKIRSTGCLPSDTNRSALMLGTANERLSVSLTAPKAVVVPSEVPVAALTRKRK